MGIYNDLTIELFDNKDSAERAFEEAIKSGYTTEEINVLMSEDSKKKYYDSELIKTASEDGSVKGLAIGGALGGALGASLAAVIALGSNFVVPGLGLIIVGPLAGAGGIYGGLMGSLIGWGIPEDNATIYEKGIQKGDIVLAVKEFPNRPSLKTLWEPYRAK